MRKKGLEDERMKLVARFEKALSMMIYHLCICSFNYIFSTDGRRKLRAKFGKKSRQLPFISLVCEFYFVCSTDVRLVEKGNGVK